MVNAGGGGCEAQVKDCVAVARSNAGITRGANQLKEGRVRVVRAQVVVGDASPTLFSTYIRQVPVDVINMKKVDRTQ